MRSVLARIAGRAVERPTAVIAAAVLLTLIGAIAALRLQADRSPSSLVNRGSGTYAETQRFYDQFGDEPVEILVKGNLRQLFLTSNLGRLLTLESCLSGKAPGGRVIQNQPAPAPCAEIAQLKPSAVVFGPATFLNQFAIEANNLLSKEARGAIAQAKQVAGNAALRAKRQGEPAASQRAAALAAGQQVLIQFEQQIQNLAVQYGQSGPPRINDPRYVESVICDSRLPGCQPKARLAAITPSANAALISIRLLPGLSDAEREKAISVLCQAVA